MRNLNEQDKPLNARLRVLLADASPAMRSRFREELQHLPFVELVGEANTSDEALALFLQSRPDVVVVSILLPEHGGFEVLRCIKRAAAKSAVILTSLFPNQFIEQTTTLMGGTSVCSVCDGFVQFRAILQRLSSCKSARDAT